MPWSRAARLLTALALFFTCASVAFAEDPPTTRQTIVSVPISPGDDGRLEVNVDQAEYFPIAATWGVIGNVYKSGGASLWCAGTPLTYQYSVPVDYFSWGGYPGYGNRLTSVEPVRLVGTTPVSLMRKNDGNPASTVTVTNETTGEEYPKTTYTLDVDANDYPTIARSSSSTMPAPVNVKVSYTWPTNGAWSTAKLEASELANYYDSWLSFNYLMPKLLTNDGAAFTVRWFDQANSANKYSDFNIPLTSAWQSREYHVGTEFVPLARRAGTIEFGFNTQGSSTTNRAQGPAIDDILISGYKYGPVDGLTAQPGGTAVALSWGKPNRTPASAADDERAIGYRVWRKLSSQSNWTEATSARLSTTDFVDSPASGVYDYLVQAWDPVSGAGYGESKRVNGVSVNVASDAIMPTISYSGVAKGAKYTAAVTPVFSAKDNVGVTSLSATLNGKAFVSGTPITSSGSYSLVITAKDARGNTASETIAFTIAIPGTAQPQPKPKVSLGTPVAPKTMKKNKSYTVYGSLKPRHTSGSKPVRIYKYKKVKVKGKTTYQSYGYTTAKAYNYSSYSRYKAKIKLTSKGTWRLKAYAPADSKHAATWSSKYDTVTVK